MLSHTLAWPSGFFFAHSTSTFTLLVSTLSHSHPVASSTIPHYIHPFFGTTVQALFNALLVHTTSILHKVIPFLSPAHYPHINSTVWPLSLKTYLMAIINATPDSSSAPSTSASALAEVYAAVEGGADIIDVGGYSTRPGASPVSHEEKLAHVIQGIRQICESGYILPILVDTFHPAVVHAAVEAGAGEGDREGAALLGEMARVASELRVPIVMMHFWGAHHAGSNQEYTHPGGVLHGQHELGKQVDEVLRCRVRRCHMVVDPGFGFSKTIDGNVELLARMRELTAQSKRDRNHWRD